MNSAPIGVFDSGYGGLTVARAILAGLPQEAIVYLGDSLHQPYGVRPIEQVRELALAGLDYLADAGVKALVIACNTASAAILPQARLRYGLPVIEVIAPAARLAAATTRGAIIGVLCTQSTKDSQAYDRALAELGRQQVVTVACPRFVELVEQGTVTGPEVLAVAKEYLSPLLQTGSDTIILGCTHFPLLAPVLREVTGSIITLIDSATETAAELLLQLAQHALARSVDDGPPRHQFLTTGDAATFSAIGRNFLGRSVDTGEFRLAP
jgi:glutamate racemase